MATAVRLPGGVVKADLLWTNPSSAAMADGYTVTLDLTKYEGVIIDSFPNGWNRIGWGIGWKHFNTSVDLEYGIFEFKSYGRRAYMRSFTVSDTGIRFGQGADGDSGNQATGVCIPHHIWGIKIEDPLDTL